LALNFWAIAIDDALVLLDLLLVALILGMFLSLHVVTDQSACSQACARADCRACSGTPERRADQSARRCATERAYARAFFSRRYRSAGAADCAHNSEPENHDSCLFADVHFASDFVCSTLRLNRAFG
jgi:hypothetical protein